MVPNGSKALHCPERDVDSDHETCDDENSSYEDESISDDEESYISYYSTDQLTVIVEETDQDLLEEMSIRGSTSCRCRHESFKLVEDIPPSPPVRRWTEEMELKNNLDALTLSPQSSSCRTSTTSNITLSSQSTAATDDRFPPPLTYSGDSRISHGSQIQSWDEDDHHCYDDDDDDSCFSGPLNDQPSTCFRGEPKFGNRQNRDNDESMQGSSYRSLSLQGSAMVSLQNGNEVVFASQSDDEYTFVSCTTGDDMSIISDIGSSRHARSVVSMEEFERDNILPSSDQPHPSNIQMSDSGVVGTSSNRRMSGLSMDGDFLSPIPEGDNSDDENPAIFQQPLNYQLVQDKLSSQIQSSLAKICENETLLLDGSNTASSHRLIALKRRLQLERYGGMRRRRTFERAKNVLGKKLKHPTVRLHYFQEHPTQQSHDDRNEIVPALDDNLAKFGGLTRRESFRRNKSSFEKKFDKDIKPITGPLRRRRSLSPVRRQSSFDKADFHLRMSKSESQLIVDMRAVRDQLEEEEVKGTDSEVVEKLKIRQERFGGLVRRKSFHRSRRFLKKKFERIQARSEEDKERFAGLQRMASYKQSRQLFEDSTHGRRNTRSRVTNVTSDYEVCDTNSGKTSIDVNGRHIIASICASAYRIPCTSFRQI